jgi:ABC-type transport system substrate-binding protein
VQPLLAEEVGFGAEGGAYSSPFGEWNLDESGQEVTLKTNGTVPADVIARYLLSLSTPGSPLFSANIAGLLASISISREDAVVLHLKRVHVRPEALLQLTLPTASTGAFTIADYAPTQVVFAATKSTAGTAHGPRAIVEQTLADDDAAINALRNGDVDVIDRVPPWQVERLRAINEIHIGTYKLPTVHVLIPNLQHPLLAKREFRRALCYGIDRKWILDRVVLGGNPQPGFDLLSGPFPTGISLSDPIRYAYNNQIQPRSFEPRLATILSTVAWASVQNPHAKENKDKPAEKPTDTKLPDLLLVHPSDPVARVACQSIQAQLARQGVTVKLRELTADELIADKVEYDLRYAELAVWEPVANARQIYGSLGILRNLQSPYIQASLDNLDSATNWKDVRARLAELHELSDHELPIIPLWQTINYFAYRASVQGIGDSPMTLYQNIGEWSNAATTNVARATN